MATYSNPGSFMPNVNQMTVNPMQGYYDGVGLSATQQLLDRDYRDSDQDFLSKLNKYKNELADNPVQEAERAGKLADFKTAQDFRNTGLPLEEKVSDAKTKISGNTNKQSADKMQEFQRKGEYINQLSNELKENPYQATKDPYRWKGYQEEAKKHDITLPDYTPDLENGIHSKAAAYQKTIPYLQKMAEIRETGSQQRQNTALQNEGHMATTNATTASHERIADKVGGRAIEEAYRAEAAGTATPGQKKIIALHLAEKFAAASMNSTGGKLAGLEGGDAQAKVLQKLLDSVLGDSGGGQTKGGDTVKSADDANAGDVYKGFKFKGGNRKDKSNWEKVK
jgi:hypothetical protein